MKQFLFISALAGLSFSGASAQSVEAAWEHYLNGAQLALVESLQSIPANARQGAQYDLLRVLAVETSRARFLDATERRYRKFQQQGHHAASLPLAELLLTLDPTRTAVAQSYVDSLLNLEQPYKAFGFMQTYLADQPPQQLPLDWQLLWDRCQLEAEISRNLDLFAIDQLLQRGAGESAQQKIEALRLAFPADLAILRRHCLADCYTSELQRAVQTYKEILSSDWSAALALLQEPMVRLRLLVLPELQQLLSASIGAEKMNELLQAPLTLDGVNFRFIPAGMFSRADGAVRIERSFWLSEREWAAELYAQRAELPRQNYQSEDLGPLQAFEFPDFSTWVAMAQANPAAAATLPLVNVSWDQVQAYCQDLSANSPFTYRLPNEAEWELACRAGSTYDYSFGDTVSLKQANYSPKAAYGMQQAERALMAQANFKPNSYGLYDMHGNVAEWTNSAYRPFSYGITNHSCAAGESGERIVVKGGSWLQDGEGIQSAARLSLNSEQHKMWIGCRLVVE